MWRHLASEFHTVINYLKPNSLVQILWSVCQQIFFFLFWQGIYIEQLLAWTETILHWVGAFSRKKGGKNTPCCFCNVHFFQRSCQNINSQIKFMQFEFEYSKRRGNIELIVFDFRVLSNAQLLLWTTLSLCLSVHHFACMFLKVGNLSST